MGGYVVGAIVGLAFGFLVGYGKYVALWRNIIKTDREIMMGALYMRMGIGYGVNVLALVIVFFLRNLLPFNFTVTIVAVAVGLSLCGKLAPTSKIFNHVKENVS